MLIRTRMFVGTLLLACFTVAACQPSSDDLSDDTADERVAGSQADSDDGVVRIVATDFAFEAPAEVPSGWTTLELSNEGEQEHFVIFWKMPEGLGMTDYQTGVVAAFAAAGAQYDAGEIDRGEAFAMIGSMLPEWYPGVQPASGVGLTSPGRIARTSVNFEPGTYVMECYVKTPEGVYHTMLGMLREITVTDDPSGNGPPEPDVLLSISNDAIEVEGALTAGQHVVGVDVMENPEGLLKHDIHLIRLDNEATVADVVTWFDFMDELMAPAPVAFLGGAEDMPAGERAFIEVDLRPGRHAFISESYGGQGIVHEFTIE